MMTMMWILHFLCCLLPSFSQYKKDNYCLFPSTFISSLVGPMDPLTTLSITLPLLLRLLSNVQLQIYEIKRWRIDSCERSSEWLSTVISCDYCHSFNRIFGDELNVRKNRTFEMMKKERNDAKEIKRRKRNSWFLFHHSCVPFYFFITKCNLCISFEFWTNESCLNSRYLLM